jgi:Lipid A 3-O-deacylase (PagL)
MVFLTERVALTFGARVQHISNADRCSQNEGLNSIIGLVGLSYLLGPISPR